MKSYKTLLVILVLVFGSLESYGATGGALSAEAAAAAIKGRCIGLTTESTKRVESRSEMVAGVIKEEPIEGLVAYDPSVSCEAINYKIDKISARDGAPVGVNIYLPIDWIGKKYPVLVSYYGGGVKPKFGDLGKMYCAAKGNIVVDLIEEAVTSKDSLCCSAGLGHATRLNHTNYPRQLIDDLEDMLADLRRRLFWGQPIIDAASIVISKTGSFGGHTAAEVLISDRASLFHAYWMESGGFDSLGKVCGVSYSGSGKKLFRMEGNLTDDYDFGRRIPQTTEQTRYYFNRDSVPLMERVESMPSAAVPTVPIHLWLGLKDDAVPPTGILAFYKLLKRKGFNVTLSVAPNGGHCIGPEDITTFFAFTDAVVQGKPPASDEVPVLDAYTDLCMQERETSIDNVRYASRTPSKLRDLFASIGKGTFKPEDINPFIENGVFIMPQGYDAPDPAYGYPGLYLGHSIFGRIAEGAPRSNLEGWLDMVHEEVEREFNRNPAPYFADLGVCISNGLEAWHKAGRMLPCTEAYFREQLFHMEKPAFHNLDNYLRIYKQTRYVSNDLYEKGSCIPNSSMFRSFIDDVYGKAFAKVRGEFLSNAGLYAPRVVVLLQEIYAGLPASTKASLLA